MLPISNSHNEKEKLETFKEYMFTTYSKISKKALNKIFLNNIINIEELKKFTIRYQIKFIIYSSEKKIYSNEINIKSLSKRKCLYCNYDGNNYLICKKKHTKRVKTIEEIEKQKKSTTIGRWKRIGLIHNNYDELYSYILNCKLCEICGHDFTRYRKCMDHDHETNLFRYCLCQFCNNNDNWKIYPKMHLRCFQSDYSDEMVSRMIKYVLNTSGNEIISQNNAEFKHYINILLIAERILKTQSTGKI